MPRHASFSRRRQLQFEPLEERRLLAIIADTFAESFAQVSRTSGSEITVLTGDTAGHTHVFYRPNDELGYIDPATGNLLSVDVFAGTSSIVVLDATVTGNISSLVGKTYSNGQAIATNGGNTVYHRDGSIMRSSGVWTYDAGAALKNASGNLLWSNGNQLMTGASLFHSNGAALRTGTSLFFVTGGTFQNGTTLSYINGQAVKNAAGNYFYQTGNQLRTGNVIYHPTGGTMIEANGTVRNANGDLSFTPYTRTNTFNASEVQTNASPAASTTTVAIQNETASAFVAKFRINYLTPPPTPLNITVTAPAAGTLRFSWTSGGGSTTGYRVAAVLSVSPPTEAASAVNTSNTFYEVSGLAAGQEVTVRVWARDGAGLLSTSVFATGVAGQEEQVAQTGSLIASSMQTTFAQICDSVDKNVVYTVDRFDNFFIIKYVNDEIGYVNLANGDRLVTSSYVVPHTDIAAPDIVDFRVVGNLNAIPSGAKYSNGSTVRSGNTFYYDNGAVLMNASNSWFYENGNTLQNTTTAYWAGGVVMRSGTTSRFQNNAILKSGGSIFYQTGAAFKGTNSYSFPNGLMLQNSTGGLFYQTGAQLFASDVFKYSNGTTMINSTGAPFTPAGTAASIPFENAESLSTSTTYVCLDDDRIARYAVAVQSGTSVFVLGGSVDYAARNGDFNGDNTVSAIDYVLWRNTQGSTFELGADGNGNSTVDAADHTVWRAHFGQTLPPAGGGGEVAATTAGGETEAVLSIDQQELERFALPTIPRTMDENQTPLIAAQPHGLDCLPQDDALLAWLDSQCGIEKPAVKTDFAVTANSQDPHANDDALGAIVLLLNK